MISLGIMVKQFAENPALLGLLGDMHLKHTSSHPGHVGFLLEDPVEAILYAVELKLGPTDDRQIIRLVESWAATRNRHPRSRCIPVLVAEQIAPRYWNVLRLISRSVPIVVREMRLQETGEIATFQALRLC